MKKQPIKKKYYYFNGYTTEVRTEPKPNEDLIEYLERAYKEKNKSK